MIVSENTSTGFEHNVLQRLQQDMKNAFEKCTVEKKPLLTNKNSIRNTVWFSIGFFFNGSYSDDRSGNTFSSKSACIEISGADSELLLNIALTISKILKNDTFLVIDYNTYQFLIVDHKL
ncbi:MAG: hypothetical protein JW794_10065 [Candidatus Cloacimonetes bacterium]|nr:hypothetical protein [Candidatus Cloacimonadota bacterium]